MLKPSSWFGDMVRLQWQPLGDAKQVRADRHHSRQLKSGIAFLLALAIATPLAAHGARDHWIIPAESSQLESTAGTMTSLVAALSQDIGRIAFEADRTGNFDIYVMSADGSGVTNLTNHFAEDTSPKWSPDGTRIIFESLRTLNHDIFVMHPDGSGVTNLTNHRAEDGSAAWSPDGTRIAFSSDRERNPWINPLLPPDPRRSPYSGDIYVMNADGSGLINLTNHPAHDDSPSWSPDGTRIVFESDRDGHFEIYVMNADGSGVTNLSNHPAFDQSPRWSPDGTRIVFESDRDGLPWLTPTTPVDLIASPYATQIYVMNPDGSNQTNITNNTAKNEGAAWSPDGTRIAFETDRDRNFEIYVMNADGSNPRNLTNHPAHDKAPSWTR